MNIERAVKKKFKLAMLLTFMLVLGIPMIVFGAIKFWPVMVIGIIFTVLGFYGCPLMWCNYGEARSQKNLYNYITKDGIESIEQLARLRGESPKKTFLAINKLMKSRYLTGYILTEDLKYVIPLDKYNRKEQQARMKGKTNKCPNCGAISNGDCCEYCGFNFI